MKLFKCWDTGIDLEEHSTKRSFNMRQGGSGPEGGVGGFGSAIDVGNVPGPDAGAGVNNPKGKGKGKNKGKNKGTEQDPIPPAKPAKTPIQIAKAVARLRIVFKVCLDCRYRWLILI